MNNYTPRSIPGGRGRKVSYRPMEGQEDIEYNIQQLFALIQDLLDEIGRLKAGQDTLIERINVLHKQVKELQALHP